jgi:hypothetical protein
MKHIVFFAIVVLAAPGWAQDKPAAKEPADKEKPAAEKQAAVGAPRIPKVRRWHEDARHCLERPTNTEIIKCAEEYL